tara:strand:+ start:250 stop:609 length:360 start_codon:yes stop_codon:yes gene_type:complete
VFWNCNLQNAKIDCCILQSLHFEMQRSFEPVQMVRFGFDEKSLKIAIFHGFKKLARFLLMSYRTVVLCRGAFRAWNNVIFCSLLVSQPNSAAVFPPLFSFPDFKSLQLVLLSMCPQSTY